MRRMVHMQGTASYPNVRLVKEERRKISIAKVICSVTLGRDHVE